MAGADGGAALGARLLWRWDAALSLTDAGLARFRIGTVRPGVG